MRLTNHSIIIISLFLLLLSFHTNAAACGEPDRGRLLITNIQVKNLGDSIELSFNFVPDQFSIKKKEVILVTPVISDGTHQAEFLPFAIVGKRGKISSIRSLYYQKSMKVVGYKQVLVYNAKMKYEDWMKGSILAFESSTKICTKRAMLTTATVDGRILQDPDVEIIEIIKEITPVQTTAERLSQDYNFLTAISKRSEFGKENGNKSVSILFKSGSSMIDSGYQDNEQNLDLLVSTIDKINHSPDSRVTDILIVGYASPEGDYRMNLDFAEKRAIALRDYLIQRTKIDKKSFEMINGGIDWFGLYRMVDESDMPYKEEVLPIIDSNTIKGSNGKQSRRIELMGLKGGVPYRYMLKNFFPKLRSGTCIKVFYENIDQKTK